MSGVLFMELFKQTLTEPRVVGARLMAMNLPGQALWLALAAIAVVMSLLAAAMVQVAPLPEGEMGELITMNPAYRAPLVFALLQWGQAVIGVFVLTWIGRIFGGQARIEDMLVVTIWIQIMAFLLGLGMILVIALLPPAGALAILAYVAWGVWITISMIDAAHRFGNVFKAIGVLVMAFFALALGSGLLAGMIGITSATGG